MSEGLAVWLERLTNWILIVFSFDWLKFKYPYGAEWLLWGTAQFWNFLSWWVLLQTGPNWFECKFHEDQSLVRHTHSLWCYLGSSQWASEESHVHARMAEGRDERVGLAFAEDRLYWLRIRWHLLFPVALKFWDTSDGTVFLCGLYNTQLCFRKQNF